MDVADGEVCLLNIDRRGQRKRLRLGVIMLGVTLVAGTALMLAGVRPAIHLALFAPAWLAGIGIFQSWEKT